MSFDNVDKGVREQTTLNDRWFEQTRIDDKQYSVPRKTLLSLVDLVVLTKVEHNVFPEKKTDEEELCITSHCLLTR